jgi:hypothetical protein
MGVWRLVWRTVPGCGYGSIEERARGETNEVDLLFRELHGSVSLLVLVGGYRTTFVVGHSRLNPYVAGNRSHNASLVEPVTVSHLINARTKWCAR